MLKIKKTKQSIIVIINTTCNLIQTAVVCIPHIHFFHLNQRCLSKLVKIDRRVIAKLQNAKFYEMTQQMLVVGSMSVGGEDEVVLAVEVAFVVDMATAFAFSSLA